MGIIRTLTPGILHFQLPPDSEHNLEFDSVGTVNQTVADAEAWVEYPRVYCSISITGSSGHIKWHTLTMMPAENDSSPSSNQGTVLLTGKSSLSVARAIMQ